MSKWAAKRKRRILFFVGIAILIIFAFISYAANNVEPTCFDGAHNGTETGVDCGGACTRICYEDARNLITWWERPFKVAPGLYNTVAYIENQNLYSGIREVDYEFRLYDRDNILVSEPIIGKTFIEPNKRSAIFEAGITTGEEEAYTSFFKITRSTDWLRVPQEYSYDLFTVTDPVLTNQDTAPKLQAKVENKTFFNFTDVPVIAVLYNREDNAIASSRTFIDSIDQGQSESVFYSWPEPFGDEVSRIEIIPRIDPFGEREQGL